MPNIKNVGIGQNKFCGPAVLSILTGKGTDECARVISKINGQYTVTGVLHSDLVKAAVKMGFNTYSIEPTGSLFRTITSIIKEDGMYIISVPGHFVCVEIADKKAYFCDNHTKEVIPAASSARLGQQVAVITRVEKNLDFVEEKLPVMLGRNMEVLIVDGYDGNIVVTMQRKTTYDREIFNSLSIVCSFTLMNETEAMNLSDSLIKFLNRDQE